MTKMMNGEKLMKKVMKKVMNNSYKTNIKIINKKYH